MKSRGSVALVRAVQLALIAASLATAGCSVIPTLAAEETTTTTTPTTTSTTTTTVPTTTTSTTAPTTTSTTVATTTSELEATTSTTAVPAPNHRLPDSIAEAKEEFVFQRSTGLRVMLVDDLSVCGDNCGETELLNDGSRVRRSYATDEETRLPPASDADLFSLLESLEASILWSWSKATSRPVTG